MANHLAGAAPAVAQVFDLRRGRQSIAGYRPALSWRALSLFLLGTVAAFGQVPAAQQLWPNLVDNIERPLRYRADGADFVITNGSEFFNRPLYGGNNAFRVDAGDRPEFVLYLPGRGGNLRLALHTPVGTKWLHDATTIEARYRPGLMLYEIRDPLLGPSGVLKLAAVALAEREGLAVRVELTGATADVELVSAYGGVNGERGRRDGDIGTESVPISEWFQLKPEACRDNVFTPSGDTFTLRSKAGELFGRWPAGSQLALGDAGNWASAEKLLATVSATPGERPVLVGRTRLTAGRTVYFGVELREPGHAAELDVYREVSAAPLVKPAGKKKNGPITDWARAFAEAEAHFAALRGHVTIETPDPWLNAAVGALNVAADAVWDEPQQGIMHGSVAWRTQLLGWRGPYALDALGWPERARANFTYWLGWQNTAAIPAQLPPPDAASNLARSEAGLHSNGDMSNSHYDMNIGFIDALFRHLLWNGDKELARQAWPVMARHLAWEQRLFRREFVADGKKLPLYEAYAAIWASDDLQYSGGGTAHGSAYNYWHNRMAARIAPLAGADPAPYMREADLIAEGMRKLLWTDGHFAESKDWLGRQLLHPSAAIWSFYHTMDSRVPNADEAGAMAAEIIGRVSIPVRGPGVPDDAKYAVLPTTDWLPYTWSLNNVVLDENGHTALGLWQAGRPSEAFVLLKSALLASMYLGICPGNVGSMNYLDVYRRESQRDFADGSGVLSRALVEGLFGVHPDALAGELVIQPGFPVAWNHARLKHPFVEVSFQRQAATDTYQVASSAGKWQKLRLVLPASARQAEVSIDGAAVKATVAQETGKPARLELTTAFSGKAEIRITWIGGKTAAPAEASSAVRMRAAVALDGKIQGARREIDLAASFNDRVTEIFRAGKYVSPRSPFVSLALPSQGIGYWAGHVNATAEIDDTGLRAAAAANNGRITLPNGVTFATPGAAGAKNILFTSQWDNYPREAAVSLTGKARRVHLLMAGSTNTMQSRFDNGEVIVTYADGATARLALRNPETWWPIEQDYFVDDYQFQVNAPLPTRVDLKTGNVRVLDETFKGKGRTVPGGAATVLSLALDPAKELKSLTVRTLANDVVIGLMAATLEE